MDLISQYDVVCLSELHTTKDISLPGFSIKKQKFRPKKNRGPKIGGGIAVYTKQKISHNFEVIPNKSTDSIWLKTTESSPTETIHLGFYYCSPETTKSELNFLETVGSEIGQLLTSNTYIFGDFNARTKDKCENITHDKYDDILGIENSMIDTPPPRNSEDMKTINKRGKDFLDLCRINDLCIANGRTIGDIFGKYTCHQKRGSSVVDYLISSHVALKKVASFTVGEYKPNLSDHCSIAAAIQIETPLPEEMQSEAELSDLPSRYIWNEEGNEKFSKILSSPTFKTKVHRLMTMSEHPSLAQEVEDLLKEAANVSSIRKTHSRKTHNNNPPWFDQQCSNLKEEIRGLGKHLKSNPHDTRTREKIYFQKKKLRNIIRKNKFDHRKSIIDNMCTDLSKGEHKKYWKLLRKLEDQPDFTSYMPSQRLIDHFKELLSDANAKKTPPTMDSTTGIMDHPITLDELKLGSKILKYGKSPGMDIIINEMLRPLVELYPELILKLFNEILSNIWIKKDWILSIITALHKKGPKDNPNNYRGIALMSCMIKLFLSIINNRVSQHIKDKKTLSSGQLGFVTGNRTSDPHIILNNIVHKYCHQGKKKIYGCFIDFSKAFDNVPRDILLQKLKKAGVDGKVFEIIRTIYEEDMMSVKIGNKFSKPFKPNKGVRQGCVLSPNLFNIFLSDIQATFDKCGHNIKLGSTEISSLLWADDILLLSTSKEGLQAKLNNLADYCKENKLDVNTDKTKVMIFSKTGRLLKDKFYFKKETLENVREYKYLGFIVTPSGEIRTGLQDLRNRALKALTKIRKALGTHFHYNISNSIHLFNYMVKPILLYCSDYWGCLKQPKNNPIEKLYLSFCKQLLGVRKSTNTSGVLLELGLIPINIYATKASIKNWERIRKSKCTQLLKDAYMESVASGLPWSTSIKDIFTTNNMLQLYRMQGEPKNTRSNTIFTRLKNLFEQAALNDIKESSKLNFYSLLKTTTGREGYLTDIKNVKHRHALTRLRLSSHLLTIETGRHKKIQKDERICPLCNNGIEDETHFLIQCPSYEQMRGTFPPITTTDDDLQKSVAILAKGDQKLVAKFIYEAFAHRDILIDVQSTILDIIKKVESNCKTFAKKTQPNRIAIGKFSVAKILDDGLSIKIILKKNR